MPTVHLIYLTFRLRYVEVQGVAKSLGFFNAFLFPLNLLQAEAPQHISPSFLPVPLPMTSRVGLNVSRTHWHSPRVRMDVVDPVHSLN